MEALSVQSEHFPGGERQEDQEFKANLNCILSLRPASAAQHITS